MDNFIILIVCFIAGAGAGLGTGFAGMSAALVIGPMLTTFLNVPAYKAVGIGLFSDVLASAVSAYTYKKMAIWISKTVCRCWPPYSHSQ